MSLNIRPNPDLVEQLFKGFLPDYDYLLRKCATQKKWLRFSPRLFELIERFKCQNYPELYQSEAHLLTALYRAIFETEEQITEFNLELNALSVDEINEFLNKFIQDNLKAGQWIDDNVPHLDSLDWSPEAQAKALEEWQKMPIEEQQRVFRVYQYSLAFLLASFHNYLALMVHGKKLTQLVSEAMAGCNHSFCLAIHIDKSIIDYIPYFKERYQQAKQEGNDLLLKQIGTALAKPQWAGRIRHRLLFMLFALLDGMNWLDHMKHREILDICDRLELDRYGNRIETENALTKRLKEYRDFQKINGMSMP